MPGSADLLMRQMSVLRRCASHGPQRFCALRDHLGVSATSAVRVLRSLCSAGLLRNQDGAYALAVGATRLAVELLGGQPQVGAAEEAVAALARQTGASAACWTLEAGRLILVAKREVDGGFHYVDRFAHRSPASSLFGIAILAGSPDGLRGSGPAVRRLARQVAVRRVCAGGLPSEPGFWRVAAPVHAAGAAAHAIGVSRHAQPAGPVAERDVRCVAAAARMLAHRLAGG